MDETFDNVPVGELKDFDDFRSREFAHVYFCPTCSRSFDSAQKEERCKFCFAEVKELMEKKKENRKNVYTYFCPTCEKSFSSGEKFSTCPTCSTDYIHAYSWSDLHTGDKLYIKFRKSVAGILAKRKSNTKTRSTENELKKALFTLPNLVFRKRSREETPTF